MKEKKYWFKTKTYGWGWRPVTWQGWVVTLVFSSLIVINFYRIDSSSHSIGETLTTYIPQTLMIIAIMVIVAYSKGEKPHWSWGNKKNERT